MILIVLKNPAGQQDWEGGRGHVVRRSLQIFVQLEFSTVCEKIRCIPQWWSRRHTCASVVGRASDLYDFLIRLNNDVHDTLVLDSIKEQTR